MAETDRERLREKRGELRTKKAVGGGGGKF